MKFKILLLLLAEFASAQTPAQLDPPKGQTLLFKFAGKGAQIYACQQAAGRYSWIFKRPEAKLLDDKGQLAGKHYAGPTWEAEDGSQVVGKVLATVAPPEETAIPWLLLTAVSHKGDGLMSKVESIQRLQTKGGKPDSVCAAGNEKQEVYVPYQADYYFYGVR